MELINYFNPQPEINKLPTRIISSFNQIQHDLASEAAKLLMQKLELDYTDPNPFFFKGGGKMFGVLVVADHEGKVGYLSAFSGMLFNKWLISGFVPPAFNHENMVSLLDGEEQKLSALSLSINGLKNNKKRQMLVESLEVYKLKSTKLLSELKRVHKKNKSNRKISRENIDQQVDPEIQLFYLSQLSQDDKREYKAARQGVELKIKRTQQQINELFDNEITQLTQTRKQLSQSVHPQVFKLYQLLNSKGVLKPIANLFKDNLPPGGAGDCAAPKLIQYANIHRLKILALSEFWWGASPNKEIRHHQHFYPPCRSKCHHIIPFMLDGLKLDGDIDADHQKLEPEIIYEDDALVVINKPEGMLSIPGKLQQHSVLSWLRGKYPEAEGALLLHRLDQATSGIMLAAKNSDVYKAIQKQFINRTIKKRYVAVLEHALLQEHEDIDLPLRVDLDDRPRQLVCFEYGKSAQTRVELIRQEGNRCRVYFYPKTGRTHQLRVHAAHQLGLDNPIVGDALYGDTAERLMLHAERIEFFHPVLKRNCVFQLDAAF